MSSYWPHDVDTQSLERLGPWFDLFVGTEGRTNDVYAAYSTHGARTIILSPGAILSADLTIAENNVVIWSPFNPQSINLGGHKITITGQNCHLAGFRLNAPGGVGIEMNSSGSAWLERVAVLSAGSHGIYLNGAGNDIHLDRCYVYSCGGDGLRIAAGMVRPQVIGGLYYGNTGYGINDLANTSILNGPRVAGNTAGQVNGTPAQNHAVTT